MEGELILIEYMSTDNGNIELLEKLLTVREIRIRIGCLHFFGWSPERFADLLVQMTQLKEIDIDIPALDSWHLAVSSALSYMPGLETVNLHFISISDLAWSELVKLPSRLVNLKAFYLPFISQHEKSLEFLRAVRGANHITETKISIPDLFYRENAYAEEFADTVKSLTSIKEVSICGTNRLVSEEKIYRALGTLPLLEQVHITNRELGYTDQKIVESFFDNSPCIKRIVIDGHMLFVNSHTRAEEKRNAFCNKMAAVFASDLHGVLKQMIFEEGIDIMYGT